MINLSTQIVLSYISVLAIAAFVGGLVTILLEQPHIDTTVATMSETMEISELENLQARSESLQSTAASMFGQFISDVEYQSLYSAAVFNESLPIISYYPNYFVLDRWTDPPPGLPSNGISYNYSSWYKHSSNSSIFLNGSSILDNVHNPILRSNPTYAGLYIGFQDGLVRNSPYRDVFSTYPHLQYTCAKDGQQVTGYDPRCRGWYVLAEGNRSDVQFTEPYNDASTNDVMITLSKAVMVNDTLIGVVGADITLQALADTILSAQILDNGYTYMCDSEKRLIVHPALDYADETVYSIAQKEFPGNVAETDAFYSFMDASVLQGEMGQSTFVKGGDEWSVTYGPVNGTAYFLLMVVPFSDILKPASSLEESTTESMNILIIIIVVLLVFIVFSGTYVALHIAHKITRPVEVFEKILRDVVDPNVMQIERSNSASSRGGYQEINQLQTKIRNLFLAVKFSTDAYHNQDYVLALQYLQEVEDMFTVIEQRRALGVLYNNKGNILRKHVGITDEFRSALETLSKAVNSMREFASRAAADLEEAKEKGDLESVGVATKALELFNATLASRLANYGDCLRDAHRFREAIAALDESYALNSAIDNIQGMLQSRGNKGLVYLDQGELALAESTLVEAFDMASTVHAGQPTDKSLLNIQMASMNLGLFYYSAAKTYDANGVIPQNSEGQRFLELALSRLYFCLVASSNIQRTVRATCVLTIDEIIQKYYGESGGEACENLVRMFPDILKSRYLDVNFLIDVSPSMNGRRIKTCEETLGRILTTKMKVGDTFSLAIFATDFNVLIPRMKVSAASLSEATDTVQTLHHRAISGRTHFYKSVLLLARSLVQSKPSEENWIVALTDGEDNEYGTKWQDAKSFCVDNKVNLVIVAIGLTDRRTLGVLEQLATEPHYFIPAGADPDAITAALTRGFEIAATGNVTMESL